MLLLLLLGEGRPYRLGEGHPCEEDQLSENGNGEIGNGVKEMRKEDMRG